MFLRRCCLEHCSSNGIILWSIIRHPDLIDDDSLLQHCPVIPIIHQWSEAGKHYAQNTHSNSAKVNAKPPGAIRLLNQDDRSSIYKKSLRAAHDHVTTGLCIALESSANSAGDRHFLLCLIGVPSARL